MLSEYSCALGTHSIAIHHHLLGLILKSKSAASPIKQRHYQVKPSLAGYLLLKMQSYRATCFHQCFFLFFQMHSFKYLFSIQFRKTARQKILIKVNFQPYTVLYCSSVHSFPLHYLREASRYLLIPMKSNFSKTYIVLFNSLKPTL